MKRLRIFNVVLAGLFFAAVLLDSFTGVGWFVVDALMLMSAVVFFFIGLENVLDRESNRKVGYLFLTISVAVIVTTLGGMWWGSS